MKRITAWVYLLMSFALCIKVLASEGPISRGSITADGTIGLTAGLSSGSSTTFSFNPSIMYFIHDHVALGGELGLNTGDGATQFIIIPSIGYYWGDSKSTLIPYARTGFGLHTFDGTSTFVATLGGGVCSMINRYVSVNSTASIDVFGSSTSLVIMAGVGVFLY